MPTCDFTRYTDSYQEDRTISNNDSASKDRKRKIAVVGLGLIGGSLAAAIQRFYPEVDVYGVDNKDTLRQAFIAEYIQVAVPRIEDLPDDIDILFLCAPLKTNLELLKTVTSAQKWKDLLITDVGSTKGSITRSADQLPGEGWSFVGGHPMAGSEKSGVDAANPFLFQNAVYVLSESENRKPGKEKMELLIGLLKKIGARIIDLPAEFHDRLVAHVSHLPYTVAVSLINFLEDEDQHNTFYQLAAGGYRDLTRIAQSSSAVWSNIIQDNKANIIEAVEHLTDHLKRFCELVRSEDLEGLQTQMVSAQSRRVKLPANTKGFINPLVDIHVEIEDKPGVLSDITTALANDAINIKDIAILKIRENLGGVLQISFGDDDTARKAAKRLQVKGYNTKVFT